MSKYIFVTGWVTSSLGKGIVCASLGLLLQSRGYSVTIQKCDPYINVDTSNMNPLEHGESFITADGGCTDLDLGYYERFLGVPVSQKNSITTGKVYKAVIEKERHNEYDGKTVQVVPHITDEITARMKQFDGEYDIIITEIGGTVGDIEWLPYIEAIRQLRWELGSENCALVHLTLLPYLPSSGELKTKPTQHSIHQLMSYGLQADILVCRSQHTIPDAQKGKLSLFCNVTPEHVIECLDLPSIYEVPLALQRQDFDEKILDILQLSPDYTSDLQEWHDFLGKYQYPQKTLRIAIVWPYASFGDAYKSVYEALIHAATSFSLRVEILWIDTSVFEWDIAQKFQNIDGLCLISGEKEYMCERKFLSYTKENRIPTIALGNGLHTMIDEYLHSKWISLLDIQKKEELRWGCTISLIPESFISQIYDSNTIEERFHTTTFVNTELPTGELRVSGMYKNTIASVENIIHPFYIGVHFLPQFQSSVRKPHPIFLDFVKKILQ